MTSELVVGVILTFSIGVLPHRQPSSPRSAERSQPPVREGEVAPNRQVKVEAGSAQFREPGRDLRAVEALLENLRHEANGVRSDAAEALGQIGDQRAVNPLIKALDDSAAGVREKAATPLGLLRNSLAVGPLVHAVTLGSPAAAQALGQIGDPRAVEPLIRAMGTADIMSARRGASFLGGYLVARRHQNYEALRSAAATALQQIGTPAVEPLIGALANDVDGSQWSHTFGAEAVRVLTDIGRPAVRLLVKALSNHDLVVRRNVARALDRLEWKPATESELAYYYLAREEWEQLGKLGQLAAEPIRSVIRRSDLPLLMVGRPTGLNPS
jgi:HEAT repeat protein